MKKRLRTLLTSTLQNCFEKGLLEPVTVPDFVIEVPKISEHGHFATNLAMVLAPKQKRSPREIASIILENLNNEEGLLENVEIAGPGFINFRINANKWREILSEVIKAGEEYGRNNLGAGKKVLVEFVSANPTGPLHLGHGRGAALGDTLCRVLLFCGFHVTREFYVNDAGQQIKILGESIFSRWKQSKDPNYPFPENGYHGDYVRDLAEVISKRKNLDELTHEEAIEFCAQEGKKVLLEEIKRVLEQFRVSFDIWYSESDLHQNGSLEKTLAHLKERGFLYENEGALWIKTTEFGDDKDRVIKKSDGEFTYFASDISYHLNKWNRGFDWAINIWGADHHGYVPRIKAALRAQGIPEDWLSVILIQLVKLWQGGQEIKMSKRAGYYVSLKELMDEVGVDAVRFVFLTKNHDSTLDFDIDVVKTQDSSNPVYYVQYAHARVCSLFRKANQEGVSLSLEPAEVVDRLVLDEEMALIRIIEEFPYVLEDICRTLEPHRLTYYLGDLAALFHKYFNLGNKDPQCRVIGQDWKLTQARLYLAKGVRIILSTGLSLLGVTAPEKM